MSVGGAAHFASTVTVAGAAIFEDAVSVSGVVNIAGNTSVGGTFLTTGKAEFEDDVSVSGNVNIGGTTTIAGAVSLASTLSVGGVANFADTVTIAGAVSLASTLSVGGAAYFASTVTIAGAAHYQGGVSVAGDITASGTINVTGDTASGDDAAIGYTSTEGIIITGQGSTNDITLKRDDDTAVLEVATGQSDIEITGGNIFFGTANKGVYLGVTSATAANLLDDYEEGNWTAALEGSTSNPSSAVTVTGNYTKIGRIVYIQAAFANVDTTGAAGGIRVTGLPFAPSPANQMTGNVTFHTIATIASGTANISPFFQSDNVAFYQSKTAAAWSETQHNAGSGRYLYFSGLYQT